MRIDDQSRLKDLYRNPVGRDVINKVLLQINKPASYVTNPLVANLKMKTARKLLSGKVPDSFWDGLYRLLNSEKDVPSPSNPAPSRPWWKEAVFYQIYPRSFADSNGDGVGDLRGIIGKLDYIKELGADAVWLSPIYDSPNDDNGYDIRDYRAIMAEMGTMEDFDELLEEAHRRGLRLIMDLVVNHTSDEHRWFKEALKDPSGKYGQYYFLRPGKEGELPNNWVSFFSGPAWRYFPEQGLYALHLFSSKQMDLNWENAELREEIYDMVRWWLDKGVDGFRLDVINYISKVPGLPDGDPFVGELMQYYGIEQYFYGPRLHEFLRELRAKAFAPYDAFSVGETPGIGMEMGRLLTGQDRGELDLVFGFDQLENPGKVRFDDYIYDLDYLKHYYINYAEDIGSNDWIAVFWENHDNPRMVSKVDPSGRFRKPLAKLLQTILLTLRGTVFMFQGQELGAANQAFTSIDQLRDVESLNLYKELLEAGKTPEEAFRHVLAGSRDHARVPMAWTRGLNAGFSEGTPWLEAPDAEAAAAWSAEAEAEDPDSVLNYTKAVMALRRARGAFRLGGITFVGAEHKHYFAYVRDGSEDGEGRYFCEFNLSPEPRYRAAEAGRLLMKGATLVLSSLDKAEAEEAMKKPAAVLASEKLGPYEARVYELKG